jgi:hypothetical protein
MGSRRSSARPSPGCIAPPPPDPGSAMPANKKLLILPGDGIGPEVMREVRRVIDWMDRRRSVTFEIDEGIVGGAAIDATGTPCPDETVESAKEADAVLFGSVGGPEMGQPALRAAAGTRHPAAAQGPRPVRQPPPGRWCSTRWRRLRAAAGAGPRPRHHDRAGDDGRRLFRRAARRHDRRRRQAHGRRHADLPRGRDRPRRARGLRARAQGAATSSPASRRRT